MENGLDRQSNILKIFNTTFIVFWLLIACFPFIWTFWGSFKVRADFFSRADWWYAITAFNTLLLTVKIFTIQAFCFSCFYGLFLKSSSITFILTVCFLSFSFYYSAWHRKHAENIYAPV